MRMKKECKVMLNNSVKISTFAHIVTWFTKASAAVLVTQWLHCHLYVNFQHILIMQIPPSSIWTQKCPNTRFQRPTWMINAGKGGNFHYEKKGFMSSVCILYVNVWHCSPFHLRVLIFSRVFFFRLKSRTRESVCLHHSPQKMSCGWVNSAENEPLKSTSVPRE